jgi:hypothetical protein
MKRVNVLGTEYTIKIVKISECESLERNHWCGSANKFTKEILIGDVNEEKYFGEMNDKEKEITTKQIMRHEITHAFFYESGLQESSLNYSNGWAENEEMVDWFAIQFPKMLKAFKEAECI